MLRGIYKVEIMGKDGHAPALPIPFFEYEPQGFLHKARTNNSTFMWQDCYFYAMAGLAPPA